jgi:ribosomal protein S18 acetylase RimI-like enzyme
MTALLKQDSSGFSNNGFKADMPLITNLLIRDIDLTEDTVALESFLDDSDMARLSQLNAVLAFQKTICLVADISRMAAGWVLVHLTYCQGLDWMPDPDTIRFQQETNAYVENLAVAPLLRNRGIGRQLLLSAETRCRDLGKDTLWLHVSEDNISAQRFYKRENWTYQYTVYPEWRNRQAMQVYRKSLN